jgi:Bacterial Ig domain/Lamin Tail Domain
MRIPTLAVTLAAAAAIVAVPTAAHAAPPVAVSDSAVHFTDSSLVNIEVLANDAAHADNTGKTLTIASDSLSIDAEHGSVTCTAAGRCTYRQDAGWVGTDTFSYTVTDGTESAQGTVSVRTINLGLIGHDLSTRFLRWPDTLDVTGFVKDSSGAFVQNVDVKLMAKVSGGAYQQVGATQNTGATGTMAITGLAPTEATIYKWMLATRSSISRQVTVTPRLGVAWEAKKLAVGDTTTATVRTAPVTEGGTLLLERRLEDGTWTTVGSHTFTATSTEEQVVPFTVNGLNGNRIYRARVPESGGREEATSGSTTVRGYKAEVVDFNAPNDTEWVKIENTGRVTFDIKDWVVADDDSTVALPSHTVRAGETVRVHSGTGRITLRNAYLRDTARYWESDSVITLTDNREFELDVFPNPVVTP